MSSTIKGKCDKIAVLLLIVTQSFLHEACLLFSSSPPLIMRKIPLVCQLIVLIITYKLLFIALCCFQGNKNSTQTLLAEQQLPGQRHEHGLGYTQKTADIITQEHPLIMKPISLLREAHFQQHAFQSFFQNNVKNTTGESSFQVSQETIPQRNSLSFFCLFVLLWFDIILFLALFSLTALNTSPFVYSLHSSRFSDPSNLTHSLRLVAATPPSHTPPHTPMQPRPYRRVSRDAASGPHMSHKADASDQTFKAREQQEEGCSELCALHLQYLPNCPAAASLLLTCSPTLSETMTPAYHSSQCDTFMIYPYKPIQYCVRS